MNKSTKYKLAIITAGIPAAALIISSFIGQSAKNEDSKVNKQIESQNSSNITVGGDLNVSNIVINQAPHNITREPNQKQQRSSLQNQLQLFSWKQKDYDNAITEMSSKIEDFFQFTDNSVLVMDFTGRNGEPEELGRMIADDLSIKLTKIARGFKIQSRELLLNATRKPTITNDSILKERENMLNVGVNTFITGTISHIENELQINFKIVNLKTGEQIFSGKKEINLKK